MNAILNKICLGMLAALMIFSFIPRSRRFGFIKSSTVPDARGHVRVKKNNNMKYSIQVHLSMLAPKKIQQTDQSYVAWMVTDKDGTRKIGQINRSAGLLSKKIKGSLETVSSSRPTKIFITEEHDASIQPVLSTGFFYS